MKDSKLRLHHTKASISNLVEFHSRTQRGPVSNRFEFLQKKFLDSGEKSD
jgi:hypothetical protein